jgi:hypothetical protein
MTIPEDVHTRSTTEDRDMRYLQVSDRFSKVFRGGILIFAVDISRHKQMEEAVRATTRKLVESQEQERVRMISGTISIDSTPLGGTTIHVRAPLTLTADANADILSEAPSI